MKSPQADEQVLVVRSQPKGTKMLRTKEMYSGQQQGVLGNILVLVQEVAPLEREKQTSWYDRLKNVSQRCPCPNP